MTTVIAGILMLGVLVFVHELGHFVVAKMCGVKVLKFSLGFGPKLISRQRGETEYQICIIPLGGYVQMLGEGSGEDGENADLNPDEEHRSFAHKPVSKRLAIVPRRAGNEFNFTPDDPAYFLYCWGSVACLF